MAVVRLFGILIVVIGVLFLLSPKMMKQYVAFWSKGKRPYSAGCLSLLFGIVFLLAASQCRLMWFVVTLGIMSLVKGIVILALGPERLRPRFGWWQKRSDTFLRLYAVLPIVIGILTIYAA